MECHCLEYFQEKDAYKEIRFIHTEQAQDFK
ncbi:Hypothetical Protein SLY_1033 [Strawberry lethal yellows phytoplasma (CPA) str. NZSb11]|uniref:Uncharacterized protein n=1 Tax=Strawberry lethal yellows phytoplasma (CPA) str. NZSb11 TaxID=980422 RepID=R4RYJ2_PHYAS|nr:Hypothetical Protein SLY_1033 [Strawberry lethal yellows phytoplasma (CPA) str. NZSb11]